MTTTNPIEVVPTQPKDFSPKLKFVVAISTQVLLGLVATAASVAVTVYVAKNITVPSLIQALPTE